MVHQGSDMLRISKVVLGCQGEMVAHGALPVRFGNHAAAVAFLEWYLATVFAEGRSGYQPKGGYWWGCDASDDTSLHCYVIADEGAAGEHSPGTLVLEVIRNEDTDFPTEIRPSMNS